MLNYKILGSGGVLPLPNRYLTSLFVQNDTTQLLVDCGEGTQTAAHKASVSLFGLDAVLLTHFHADHILGLPGIIATLGNARRTKPLFVFGPKGVHDFVLAVVKILGRSAFPIIPVEISDGDTITIGKMTVRVYSMLHSVTCLGYTFEVVRNPEYRQDIVDRFNLTPLELVILQNGYTIERDSLVLNINNFFGEDREIVKLAYATDTGYFAKLINMCKGATTAILDASYSDESQIAKSNDNAANIHMTFEQAATVAREADVQHLVLTHFSPILTDPNKSISKATNIFERTTCAFVGMGSDDAYGQDCVDKGLPQFETSKAVITDLLSKGSTFVTVDKQAVTHDTCYLTTDGIPVAKVHVDGICGVNHDYVCSDEKANKLMMFVSLERIVNTV